MAEEEQEERVLNVPLRAVRKVARTKRVPRAVEAIREFVVRHRKAKREDVWIDPEVNKALWARGIEKPPKRIQLRTIKFEDGRVEVSLPEE
ncbi:MAG TPA: 50S ribosomal protein L31e [Thermoplasmata archaeon]|nr:MAG: 50S ribosomal protein L31e [Euryarchaeota archaeon]HTD81528.1 50S ribosomal protein L31e [Thermoplasmata archaeon]